MNTSIKIKDGVIYGLHSSSFNPAIFGATKVFRASHVEPSSANGKWKYHSALTGKIIEDGLPTREAALEAEHKYYSVGGEGMKELVEGVSFWDKVLCPFRKLYYGL